MSPWQSVEHLLWWLIVALLLIVQSVVGSRLVRRIVRDLPGAPTDAGQGGAGALVGILERLLVFTLIVVGQWGVIGFVITAKSIARFRELEEKDFTDYYLAGTFSSLLVAVAAGLLAQWARTVLLGP